MKGSSRDTESGLEGSYDRLVRILVSGVLICMIFLLIGTLENHNVISVRVGVKGDLLGEVMHQKPVQEKFTVVLNTFRGRDEYCIKLIRHYATCGLVDRLVVVWNDFERTVPSAYWEMIDAHENRDKIKIEVQTSANLTNRFIVSDSMRTDALFTVDDDVLYSCRALHYAFEVWQGNKDMMVGFGPRMFATQGRSFVYGWDKAYIKKVYSILFVTKGGFLHRKYHDLFFDPQFAGLRDMINLNTTGEDMAMALLHRHYSGGAGNVRAVAVTAEDYEHDLSEQKVSLVRRTGRKRHSIQRALYAFFSEWATVESDYKLDPAEIDIWCDPLNQRCAPKNYHLSKHVRI